MKKLTFILFFCLVSLSCAAQQPIKMTQGYSGKEISYVSSQTFDNLKINDNIRMRDITEAETIEDVINLFGQPADIKKEKDVAIDGTVLFERKLVSYPGLLFVFPKKDGKYKLSRIDFTSSSSLLKLNGNKIEVGMSTQEISKTLPNIKQSNAKGRINIHVAGDNPNLKSDIKNQSNVSFSDKYIKIEYDTVTKKVKKISILIYTI